MYNGPRDPRYAQVPTDPSWRSLVVAAAVAPTPVLLLWAVTAPMAAIAGLAGAAALFLGARRTSALVRCFYECGAFTLEVAGRVRICVAQPSVETAC